MIINSNIPKLIILVVLSSCNNLGGGTNQTATLDTSRTETVSATNIVNYNETLIEARIVKGEIFKPEVFAIQLSKRTIKADINGQLTSGESMKQIGFDDSFHTRRMHFLETDRNVILFFEITDDEGSFNEVYCLDIQDLSTIWKASLFSFNLTVGQRERELLYLGAGENAYALNIDTGKIIWQTSGLYHRHGFNHFDSIDVTSKEVRLLGKIYSKENGDRYSTAILRKTDGQLLRVE